MAVCGLLFPDYLLMLFYMLYISSNGLDAINAYGCLLKFILRSIIYIYLNLIWNYGLY